MNNNFFYSVIQYRHSAFLSEALNIGVLFLFPEEKTVHFEIGDLTRVKNAYPLFDTRTVHRILLNIKNKSSKNYSGIFSPFDIYPDLENFKRELLREDDSALNFLPLKTQKIPFEDSKKVIAQYSSLLLVNHAGVFDRKRHDDKFLSKEFWNSILDRDRGAAIALKKDVLIETNGVTLEFDYSWQNGTLNLVKPVSFDYLEGQSIQHKSITYFGYLTKLKDYAESRNIKYHLLVGKPQELELLPEYEKAIKIIKSADSPTLIIPEEQIESYSKETVKYLRSTLNEKLAS